MISISPSCVYREVTCRCHVSEICDVYVKDETNFVCVEMVYACGKYSEGHKGGIYCLRVDDVHR